MLDYFNLIYLAAAVMINNEKQLFSYNNQWCGKM